MLSHAALGKNCPRPNDAKFVHEWQGLSLFDMEQAVRSLGEERRGRPPRQGWERIGPFVAILKIPDDAPVTLEGPTGAGHWLTYDSNGRMLSEEAAAMLVAYVDRVLPGPVER